MAEGLDHNGSKETRDGLEEASRQRAGASHIGGSWCGQGDGEGAAEIGWLAVGGQQRLVGQP